MKNIIVNSLSTIALMTILVMSSSNCNADERIQLQEKKTGSSQIENQKSSPQKKTLIILSDSPDDSSPFSAAQQIELSPQYLRVQDDQLEISGKIMDMKLLLKSESPRLRGIAAQSLALIRIEMGDAEQNVKLLPVFNKLLQNDDEIVRQQGLDHLVPIFRESPPKSLKPFVKPLMQVVIDGEKNSFENNSVSKAIILLGELGVVAKDAIPLLQRISKAEDDILINFAAIEAKLAIEKIQGEVD